MNPLRVEVWPGSTPEAIQVEYDVFLDAAYIERNASQRVIEYDPYPYSEFLVAIDGDDIAGLVRLIVDQLNPVDYLNLPTLNDFDIQPGAYDTLRRFRATEIVEVGTMAIRKPYRGGAARRLLTRRIITHNLKAGRLCALASIDKRFYEGMVRQGMRLTAIGEEKHYMGSVTVPTMHSMYQLSPFYRSLAHLIRLKNRIL